MMYVYGAFVRVPPPTSAGLPCLRRVRAEAERRAVNTTVQGSAADLMKAAMLSW
mgnify:CR=1 FL=1